MRVCPAIRPCAIHCRTTSADTGPYCLWSAPCILYMAWLLLRFDRMVLKLPQICKTLSHSNQTAASGVSVLASRWEWPADSASDLASRCQFPQSELARE